MLASAGVPAFESQRWRGRPILLLYSLIPWDILGWLSCLCRTAPKACNVLKTSVFFQQYVLDTQKLKHYLTWGDWSEIPTVFFVHRNESHIYTLLCVLPTGQPLAHGTTSHQVGWIWRRNYGQVATKTGKVLAVHSCSWIKHATISASEVPGAWCLPPCIRAKRSSGASRLVDVPPTNDVCETAVGQWATWVTQGGRSEAQGFSMSLWRWLVILWRLHVKDRRSQSQRVPNFPSSHTKLSGSSNWSVIALRSHPESCWSTCWELLQVETALWNAKNALCQSPGDDNPPQ